MLIIPQGGRVDYCILVRTSFGGVWVPATEWTTDRETVEMAYKHMLTAVTGTTEYAVGYREVRVAAYSKQENDDAKVLTPKS